MLRRVTGAYRAAFTGLPREVWILAVAMLVNRSGTMVLPFMSLYLITKLGFGVVAAGRVLSLYGVGAIVGGYLGGVLSDRHDPVRVQVVSLIGTGVGFFALSLARGTLAVALAVVGLSMIAECFRPALFAAVARFSAPAVRTRSLALIRLAVNLGMSFGPAIGGFLAVRHYGWLFAVDALTCWGAAAILAARLTGRVEPAAGPHAARAAAASTPWRDRPFLLFLGAMLALGVVFFQISSTMTLYFRQAYGFPEDTIGLLLALNTVIIVAVEMVLVRAMEHRNHLAIAAVGALLVCSGFALLPFGRSRAFAALTIVVWTAGEMLSLPMTNAVAASRATGPATGRYLGAYWLAFSAAFVLAPAIGTAVYQSLGPSVLWLGIGVVGVLLAGAFLALARAFPPAAPALGEP
ncbi:MAG TPA: MFS transporter [Thermoanaerobaculaceae bacterium]|nr:MFS transporter [Thermoanaerobaculaceae bacterium]